MCGLPKNIVFIPPRLSRTPASATAQEHAQRVVAWVVAAGDLLRAGVVACIAAEQAAGGMS